MKPLKNLNNHSMMYKLGSTARCFATTAPLPAPSNPVQIPVTGDARVSEVLGETSVKESTSSSTFACALPAQPIFKRRASGNWEESLEFSGTFVAYEKSMAGNPWFVLSSEGFLGERPKNPYFLCIPCRHEHPTAHVETIT